MGAIGSPSQKTGASLTGSQQDIAGQIAHFLNHQVGSPIPQYQGQLVAPLSRQQNAIQGQYSQVPTEINQTYNRVQGALQGALQGDQAMNYSNISPQQYGNQNQIQNSDLMSQQGTQNYFQQGVINPLMNAYQTQIAPQIAESFAGGGGSFNSRAGYAQGQALQQLQTQALGQQAQAVNSNAQLQAQQSLQAQQATAANNQATNQLNSSNFNTANQMNNQMNYALSTDAANRQLQSTQLYQQNIQDRIGNLSSDFAAQSPWQSQQQNVDTSKYQQYLQQQPYNNPYLTTAMNFIGQSQQNVVPYFGLGSQVASGLVGQGATALGGKLGSSIGSGLGQLGGILGGIFGGGAAASGAAAVGGEAAAAEGGSAAAGGLADIFGMALA